MPSIQSPPIRIAHFTDLHMKQVSVPEIERRVKALSPYLAKEALTADILVFSGDLAFSGKSDEYSLAESLFLQPVRRAMKVAEKNLIVVPGNHDIDRDLITVPEYSRCRNLANSRDVDTEFRSATTSWNRLSAYRKFVATKTTAAESSVTTTTFFNGLAHTKIIEVRGIQVGFACLNSSWLCADDGDKGNLFLTQGQVDVLCESIKKCQIRVAVVHHPFDWYNESECDLAVRDLKRNCDVILTGHLHKPFSVLGKDPDSTSLLFTGRAFFDGKTSSSVDDGFHIYDLNLSERKVTAYYRRYIRTRDTYDKDTEHAQDGTHQFDLNIPETLFAGNLLIVQKLAGEGNELQQQVRKELSIIQGRDEPIFVTPKLRRYSFKNGERHRDPTSLNLSNLGETNTFLVGEEESGKTILLKTLVGDFKSRSTLDDGKIPLYLDLSSSSEITKNSVLEILAKNLDVNVENLSDFSLVIAVDGITKDEKDSCKVIHAICEELRWTYVISIGRRLAADAVAQESLFVGCSFVELLPWGPSRIRELASHMFRSTDINIDQVYQTVTRCLRNCDLPSSPTIVSLYMSVFPKFKGEISGISFLRLLEKIETMRLGENEGVAPESLYYRRIILRQTALLCLQVGSLRISRISIIEIIKNYFSTKLLDVNPDRFIDNLCLSGVLRAVGSDIAFTHFIFFDYYIALAFKEKLLDEKEHTISTSKCIKLSQSLSLFAGLARENSDLAYRIISLTETTFGTTRERTLADLDKHIIFLLNPKTQPEADPDSVASENLSRQVDYEKLDEEHERERRELVQRRAALLKGGSDAEKEQKTEIDTLSAKLECLFAFYSIFKNLEDIEGNDKILLLDRILDFHVDTNFSLINFFFSFSESDEFRSAAAYMLTLSGHSFMASTLGAPSMISAIKHTLQHATNDFKRFLLILLLSDLRCQESLKLINCFVQETQSFAAVEILLEHLRQRIVSHDEKEIPEELISAFKETFRKRAALYNEKKSKSDQNIELESQIKRAERKHFIKLTDRE